MEREEIFQPGTRPRFQALKDERTFDYAPKLAPSSVQQKLAEETFKRVRAFLPAKTAQKLEARYRAEGHYINTVRYYPFPILLDEGAKNFVDDLVKWGHTYATILRKVVAAYRKPGPSNCRRFFNISLVRYFPAHLLKLIHTYRTFDELAGAHLGDDNLGGKSVEWNLGAVGGLDEGNLVAQEVKRTRDKTNNDTHSTLRPIERDPAGAILEALYWAYESFCTANDLHPSPKPFIAYTEYDDIYGSTVSICERLTALGENIHLCFGQEFSYRNDKLYTASGHPIDLVFMDCHLEDFPEGHPLIEAAAANKVALDCSPFAHLVLRSKVILALLSSPAFSEHLGLTPEGREMVEKHLIPTYLWRRKTFHNQALLFSLAARALISHQEESLTMLPFEAGHRINEKKEELVVKAAIGSVYGGSSVSVVIRNGARYQTKEAAQLVLSLISRLAAHHTSLEGAGIQKALKSHFKNKVKDLVFMAASGRLLPDGDEGEGPFWKEVERIWRHLLTPLSRGGSLPCSLDEFIEPLREPLKTHFNLDLKRVKSTYPDLWGRLKNDIQKTLDRPYGSQKTATVIERWSLRLSQMLAPILFQQRIGPRTFGKFMVDLKDTVTPKEPIIYRELVARVMALMESFFEKHFGVSLPASAKEQVSAILLAPYIRKQWRSVNPIVLQHYFPPDRLVGESGLHVSNRIHILFTRDGPRVYLSGTQVFFLKDGKPDNRYKMTGSLWVKVK